MVVEVQHIQKQLEPIIRKAGAILLSYFNTAVQADRKTDGSIVTHADKASEQYLIKELSALIPNVAFNAEESGKSGDNAYCFVIDPLDGTTNFAHGIPYFCVSVCLTYKDIPQVAAIYQPITDEYFTAVAGGMAYGSHGKLAISDHALSQGLTVVGLPYTKNERYIRLLEFVRIAAPKSFAFRCFGASALDLAYVAAGRIQGIYLADLSWWDVAAGMLLIQQAGGIVTTFEGNELDPQFKTCLAGTPSVHSALMQLLMDVQ